jgi:hypothetical protein
MSRLREFLGQVEASLGDDELGFRHQAHRHLPAPHHGHPHHPVHHTPAQMAAAELDKRPGDPDALIESLGFTPVTFVNAGSTSLDAKATPQRRMQGTRFFVDAGRTGATAAGQLLLISKIKVGGRDILGSGDPILVSAYGSTAVGAGIKWPVVGQGTLIVVTFTIVGAALGAGDSISIGAQLNGMTVGTSE